MLQSHMNLYPFKFIRLEPNAVVKSFDFLSDADADNPYTRLMYFDLMDIA